MKKMTLVLAAVSIMVAPVAVVADMEHGGMKMEHCDMMSMGKLAHEEVVDGVKATFNVIDIKTKMEKMGLKETHHIMVVFTDTKSGKKLSDGAVTVKVAGPDKTEEVKELMGMEGGFGSDFAMSKKGKYGVMCKFKLADGKVRSVKFWYTVK